MSELPPLPESDDPFEVLGVPPDATEADLRRAYVGLIKVHRPDRAPEAFARVRRAFEAARARARWRHYEADVPDEEPAVPGSAPQDGDEGESPGARDPTWSEVAAEVHEPESPPGPAAALAAAWRDVRDGVDAREVLLGLREPADDPYLALHRILIADAAGLGHAEEAIAAIGRGAPVAQALGLVLRPDELFELVTNDAFAWSNLRRQEARDQAAQLMRLRLHAFLCDGRLDRAIAEVLEDDFEHDADVNATLGWVAQEVLAVATWAGTRDLERLRRRYAQQSVGDAPFLSPQDHRAAGEALAEPWREWRVRFPSFRALRRFLVLAPMVVDALSVRLADALGGDFLARAGVYPACFHEMQEHAPELVERFILAARQLYGHPADDEGPDPLRYPPLAELETRALRERYDRAGRAALYENRIRPALFAMVANDGLSPTRLQTVLRERQAEYEQLSDVVEAIVEERSLAAVFECRRIALAPFEVEATPQAS